MSEAKRKIAESVHGFEQGNLFDNAVRLFNSLGYNTSRRTRLAAPTFTEFERNFLTGDASFNREKALVASWQNVELLFQLTTEEISNQAQLFDSRKVNNTIIESYLFLAIDLEPRIYSRSELSGITREINRVFKMPV